MKNMENSKECGDELTKGQQIRVIRKQLCLTQDEFSSILGVTRNAESDWENDRYEPNDAHWRIIKALPDLRFEAKEDLQLAFLKILPLCPACQKKQEDYIHKLYTMLRKKLERKL